MLQPHNRRHFLAMAKNLLAAGRALEDMLAAMPDGQSELISELSTRPAMAESFRRWAATLAADAPIQWHKLSVEGISLEDQILERQNAKKKKDGTATKMKKKDKRRNS